MHGARLEPYTSSQNSGGLAMAAQPVIKRLQRSEQRQGTLQGWCLKICCYSQLSAANQPQREVRGLRVSDKFCHEQSKQDWRCDLYVALRNYQSDECERVWRISAGWSHVWSLVCGVEQGSIMKRARNKPHPESVSYDVNYRFVCAS